MSWPLSNISSIYLFIFYPFYKIHVSVTFYNTMLKKSSNPFKTPPNYLWPCLWYRLILFIRIQIFDPIHLSNTAKGRIFVDILLNNFIICWLSLFLEWISYKYIQMFAFLYFIKNRKLLNIFFANYKKSFVIIHKQKT